MRPTCAPVLLAALGALLRPVASHALPAGKAWAPVERLTTQGTDFAYVTGRLEIGVDGGPVFFGSDRNQLEDAVGLAWSDTSWHVRWRLGQGGYWFNPVLSGSEASYIIWAGSEDSNADLLQIAAVFPDGVGNPDTVARIWPYRSQRYSAAMPARGLRWVALRDYETGRLFWSEEEGGEWHEVPEHRVVNTGISIGALDDSSALVAFGSDSGLAAGIATKTSWSATRLTAPYTWAALGVRLRPRPSGGYWLATGDHASDMVGLATFRDGAWQPPDSLTCKYSDPTYNVIYTSSVDASLDRGEYPVVVWSAFGYRGASSKNFMCACVPSSDGTYGAADGIWEGRDVFDPTACRDVNGDAWVAWWEYFPYGTRWTHTYTRAIATELRLEGAGRRRTLSWVLSEPAPGTWWTILRSSRGGPFEPIARVQAGPTLDMGWTDPSVPDQAVRYKLHRECFDSRYAWESKVAMWPPNMRQEPRLRAAALSAGGILKVEATDVAPGLTTLFVFDVMGRLVLRTDLAVEETASSRIELIADLGNRTKGIYFARVIDVQGRASNPVRFAVLH